LSSLFWAFGDSGENEEKEEDDEAKAKTRKDGQGKNLVDGHRDPLLFWFCFF
jgi:hypothetical protein